jgi:protein-tyrosine phosphatase
MTDGEPIRLCFVCLGNICRSPTAEGIMTALVAEAGLVGVVEVHSAGTAGWHRGEPPDDRARAEAVHRGIELRSRASAFMPGDTAFYDLVLAMDRSNERDLLDLTPELDLRDRIRLLRSFDPSRTTDDRWDGEVPDPWSGGNDGFALVFDLIADACRGLLDHVQDTMLADRDLR